MLNRTHPPVKAVRLVFYHEKKENSGIRDFRLTMLLSEMYAFLTAGNGYSFFIFICFRYDILWLKKIANNAIIVLC